MTARVNNNKSYFVDYNGAFVDFHSFQLMWISTFAKILPYAAQNHIHEVLYQVDMG